MTTINIDEAIRDSITEMLDKHSMGEELLWASDFTPHPEFGIVLAIHIWVPSGILGQKIINTIVVSNPADLIERSDKLEDSFIQVLEKSRQQRSEILAQTQGLTTP